MGRIWAGENGLHIFEEEDVLKVVPHMITVIIAIPKKDYNQTASGLEHWLWCPRFHSQISRFPSPTWPDVWIIHVHLHELAGRVDEKVMIASWRPIKTKVVKTKICGTSLFLTKQSDSKSTKRWSFFLHQNPVLISDQRPMTQRACISPFGISRATLLWCVPMMRSQVHRNLGWGWSRHQTWCPMVPKWWRV